MQPYLHNIIALIFTALLPGYILFRFAQAWRQAYASPLSAIPNAALLAPLSLLLWAFGQDYTGNFTLELPRLHEKLGPLVRIGPNEVSFYSLEIYDAVHGAGSKFAKDPRVYGEFVQGGHPALFSITDKEEHGRRRRMMGQLFNRSKMENLQDLMLGPIEQMVRVLKDQGECLIDPFNAFRALEADITTRFGFGKSVGAILSWSKDQQPLGMVSSNDTKATWMPIYSYFNGLVTLLETLERIAFALTGWRTKYTSSLKQWENWAFYTHATILSSTPTKATSPNLIETLVSSGVHPETALSEAREQIGPGTDATSQTMAHILWALAQNPRYQTTLRDELAAISFPTDLNSLEMVPKLAACIKEGIRWTGAASAILPRVVPPEGAFLEGIYLPGGTTISSSPIWYLRDPVAYPDPMYFDPYRWLTADGTAMSEGDVLRDRYYIPFSKGTSLCVATHFACYELYLTLSQLLKNFQVRLPRTQDPDSRGLEEIHFVPVLLPQRKEYVTAVITERLDIVLQLLAGEKD